MQIVRKKDFLESRFYTDEETFRVTNGRASFLFDVEDLPISAHCASEIEISDYELYHAMIWKKIQDHLPLCYSIAKKFPVDSEILVSDVGIPLMLNALRTFDPKRGEFTSYIYRLLHSRYSRYVQVSQREVAMVILDIAQVEIMQHDDADLVLYLMKCLNEEERIMIVMRFWKGLTYEEIAIQFNVVKSTVYRVLKKALAKCDKQSKQSFMDETFFNG